MCEALDLQPLPEDAVAFVRETFVLPAADPETGLRLDLIFSTTPYETQAIARAVLVDVGSREVPFATAEDLVVHRLFAGRPRDLEDAAGVVRRKGPELDWESFDRWCREFAVISRPGGPAGSACSIASGRLKNTLLRNDAPHDIHRSRGLAPGSRNKH